MRRPIKLLLVALSILIFATACGDSNSNTEMQNKLEENISNEITEDLSIDSAVTVEITDCKKDGSGGSKVVVQYCTYTNHTDKEIVDLKANLVVKDAYGDLLAEKEGNYYKGDFGNFELLPNSDINTEFAYLCDEYNFKDQKYYNTDKENLDIQIKITGLVFADGTVLTE